MDKKTDDTKAVSENLIEILSNIARESSAEDLQAFKRFFLGYFDDPSAVDDGKVIANRILDEIRRIEKERMH